MKHLKPEELVSYFYFAQPEKSKRFSELDFVRLIDDLGVETANEFKAIIVRHLHEGRNLHVIQALLAA
ncbi:hypothetical protein [Deinococcus hopiensis]|uniref:Uncharacterized protein n=1 Tax=Deinococcus hopiensis KR-140 TaxID=695939 RepID=A0A1W1UQJ1_9DEIO|nr:hypothetical protein [Deinococcus hopiensis]SMB83372.1 hypothetical protein SAMN00790413_04392 [Deinococcus hopiensis KR-140]